MEVKPIHCNIAMEKCPPTFPCKTVTWICKECSFTLINKLCDKCKVELDFCPEDFPWTVDHLICPICDGTYLIEGK